MTSTTADPAFGTSRFALINGVRLHYVEAGTGPLVVLLHGFPEFWYSWRHQIPALADAGYRVIAPDLRGYNLSGKPAGVASYRLELLLDDVAALIRHAGVAAAHVVGHDWGGLIAWQLAMRRPAVVERLAILNAAHPGAYRREVRRPDQALRSAYIAFFQLPVLPELLIRSRDFALLERLLRTDPTRPDAFTDTDVHRYKAALAQPGALTAALNYYRALRLSPRPLAAPALVTQPTLLVWGERDRFQSVRLTDGLERWVPRLRVARLPDASHWVQADAPERVNALLLELLSGI